MGYHFSRKGLAVAEKTLTDFVERLSRLYEQSRTAAERAQRLGNYVRRWLGWAQAGLGGVGAAIGQDSTDGDTSGIPDAARQFIHAD